MTEESITGDSHPLGKFQSLFLGGFIVVMLGVLYGVVYLFNTYWPAFESWLMGVSPELNPMGVAGIFVGTGITLMAIAVALHKVSTNE